MVVVDRRLLFVFWWPPLIFFFVFLLFLSIGDEVIVGDRRFSVLGELDVGVKVELLFGHLNHLLCVHRVPAEPHMFIISVQVILKLIFVVKFQFWGVEVLVALG